MTISRRDLLTYSSVGAVGMLLALPTAREAIAEVPLSGVQVPGVYRFKIGSFEITVVSDGTISFPPEVLWPEVNKDERDAVLGSDFTSTETVVLQTNVLVVNTGDHIVLIDAGSRGKVMPTAGKFLSNLAVAGVKPEQVDIVLVTHAHPDHLWGVTDAMDKERTFVNAEYVFCEDELNFWRMPNHPFETDANRSFIWRRNTYNFEAIDDRIRTIKAGGEVTPGIVTMSTPGHTPGHVSVHIASEGEELVCTGDVVGNRAVGFQHPDWRGGFDLDLDQGVKTRRSFLDSAASKKVLVASYHLPFPGLGHVAREGTAYRWIQADWMWDF
jgi:glyoxylase-like metal-dependent hydrolase (beta-lactamase superfamily II)